MGDFKVIIRGASHKGIGPFFMGKELTPRDNMSRFKFNGGGLSWVKWLKNGEGKVLSFM